MFTEPETSLVDAIYTAGLPETTCSGCIRKIERRKPRVTLRASWRDNTDCLCPECWHTICAWASRFALIQTELDLGR